MSANATRNSDPCDENEILVIRCSDEQGDERDVVYCNRDIVWGNGLTLIGHDNVIIGQRCAIYGDRCEIHGNRNILRGSLGRVFGDANLIFGNDCFIVGHGSLCIGDRTTCRGRANQCHGNLCWSEESDIEPQYGEIDLIAPPRKKHTILDVRGAGHRSGGGQHAHSDQLPSTMRIAGMSGSITAGATTILLD